MKTQTSVPTIKIDPRGKGYNNYEDYLIKKHIREVDLYMFEHNFKPHVKSIVHHVYKKVVNRKNIIDFYTHSIYEFLLHLGNGTTNELVGYTSCSNIPQTR